MDAYVTPTNDTDYSCHIKAIELSYGLYVYQTTIRHKLLITSGGGGRTHKHTQAYRCPHRNNFKKPGARQPAADMPGLKMGLKQITYKCFQMCIYHVNFYQSSLLTLHIRLVCAFIKQNITRMIYGYLQHVITYCW